MACKSASPSFESYMYTYLEGSISCVTAPLVVLCFGGGLLATSPFVDLLVTVPGKPLAAGPA